MNNESRGTYKEVNQIRFKNLEIIRPSLCDYSDVCILVKGITTAMNTSALA